MAEPEFNLLEEPWIRVMTKDHKIKELSLTDMLIYSHEYVGLAGRVRGTECCSTSIMFGSIAYDFPSLQCKW